MHFDKIAHSVTPQPKNSEQDPEWTNQVPLSRAGGVLPFPLKREKIQFSTWLKTKPFLVNFLPGRKKKKLWQADIFLPTHQMDLMLLPFQGRGWITHTAFQTTPITPIVALREDADESSPCTRWNTDNCSTRHWSEPRLYLSQKEEAGCIWGRWGKMYTIRSHSDSQAYLWPFHLQAPLPGQRTISRCVQQDSMTWASAKGCYLSPRCPSRLTLLHKRQGRINLPQRHTLAADEDEALRLWQFESLKGNCAITLNCSKPCLSTLSARSI